VWSRIQIGSALLLVAVLAGCGASAKGQPSSALRGAGSTLALPLVASWAQAYERASHTRIEYNAVGSGSGIAAIATREVDFGASDAPLTRDQAEDCGGCVQIPWALSAVAIAYHGHELPPGLRMTGNVLADVFLGRITRWDDPRLQALNPDVRLPSTRITPIFRAESSGSTYAFTSYLARVSPNWRSRVGEAIAVRFPVGIGGSTSAGVTALLLRTDGGISYVETAYALANDLEVVALGNAAGRFVRPDVHGVAAAAATISALRRNNALSIVDPPASSPRAYPISTFTYAILPRRTREARRLRAFVSWALTRGQSLAPPLAFAPLPASVVRAARATLLQLHS
jgi:phosphate transport system substrate-binding protein